MKSRDLINLHSGGKCNVIELIFWAGINTNTCYCSFSWYMVNFYWTKILR